MWGTIAMQLTYTLGTFGMSMYLRQLNTLADEDSCQELEGLAGFRYAP